MLSDLIFKCQTQTLSSIAMNFFSHHVPDFLVIGYHGRKSELSTEKRSIMGSNSNILIREIHLPTIITKRPILNAEKITFIMAVDGSQRARDAFLVLSQSCLLGSRDSLVVVHVEEIIKDDDKENNKFSLSDTKKYFEEALQKSNVPVDSKYVSLLNSDGKAVIDTLMDFVDEVDPDFLCLAPAPLKTISSVTETVVVRTNSSVILFKA